LFDIVSSAEKIRRKFCSSAEKSNGQVTWDHAPEPVLMVLVDTGIWIDFLAGNRLAAKIFRDCRKKGYTIRSSIDCLVAACAMERACPLLHKDRDYKYIEQVRGLKVVKR
jgi:hypothetical protein